MRRRRKFRYKRKKIPVKTLFLFLILSITCFFIGYKLAAQPTLVALPQLSTIGYVQVQPQAFVQENTGIVTLRNECWELTAYTSVDQATSIAMGLEGKIEFRPLTHDLMRSIFDYFGIKVLMVKIVDIQNNTFIGTIILQKGSKVLSLDSRPSDGIAIAVRHGVPIYIKQELLENYGRKIC